MNYKMFAKISIRLIALFYFMSYMTFAISSIISLIELARYPSGQANIGVLSASAPMIIMVAASILLWVFADKIAHCLIGQAPGEEISQNIDYIKIQYIAFCVAGVLIVAKATPDLFMNLFQLIQMTKSEIINNGDKAYISYLAKIIGAGIQIILGVWLVCGSKGIINAIKKLRTVGLSEDSRQ